MAFVPSVDPFSAITTAAEAHRAQIESSDLMSFVRCGAIFLAHPIMTQEL
jgi:hypothetical protein